MTVLEELQRSAADSVYSDCWSDEACRVYFGAAAFHGYCTESDPFCIDDTYSYAIEAAEALGL